MDVKGPTPFPSPTEGKTFRERRIISEATQTQERVVYSLYNRRLGSPKKAGCSLDKFSGVSENIWLVGENKKRSHL